MSWQRQQQQFKPHNNYRSNPSYGVPQPKPPSALKRQASELKSCYPLTKWCACYVNTKSNAASGDYGGDKLDITAKIESTNCYLPMDLEKTIIKQIELYQEEEKDLQQRLTQQKDDMNASKNQASADQNDKIDTFMTFTSITDRDKARELLEQNEWDLQKAAAQQFASSPNVNANKSGEGGAHHNPNGQSQKAIIRLVLPDNRQYTYQMDGNDTFWGVYGRLLQSVPELASKAFSLELNSGHELNENEFDQTLSQAQLVPRGDIKIKY